jgi:hypothetical protein
MSRQNMLMKINLDGISARLSSVARLHPTLAILYRAGMTNVVLHFLFMQQNQRV